MIDQFKSYKTKLELFSKNDTFKANILLGTLRHKQVILKKSNETLKSLSENFDNLTSDYEKDIIESKEALKGYQEEIMKRKENGVDEVNKLMSNFLFKNKTKKSLEKIIGILNRNSTNKRIQTQETSFLKSEKTDQFNRLRIQSSYRFDEIINNLSPVTATGVDFIRAMIAGLYSALPPTYCWVDDTNLGTFDVGGIFFNGEKRLANIFHDFRDHDSNQYILGGLIFDKCPSQFTDCVFFCSSTDCNSPKNFVNRNIVKQNFFINHSCARQYKKKGTLCYPVCEKINMVTCETGICAASKERCNKQLPKITTEIIEAFVDFFGHIYSLRADREFGWANPKSLENDLSVFNKYKTENKIRHNEISATIKNFERKIFIGKIRNQIRKFLKIDRRSTGYKNYSEMVSDLMIQFERIFDQHHTYEGFKKNSLSDGGLNECHPNNFGILTRTKLEREKKFYKRNRCSFSLSTLLAKIEPYMFIGYAAGFVKPICPFTSIKNPLIWEF